MEEEQFSDQSVREHHHSGFGSRLHAHHHDIDDFPRTAPTCRHHRQQKHTEPDHTGACQKENGKNGGIISGRNRFDEHGRLRLPIYYYKCPHAEADDHSPSAIPSTDRKSQVHQVNRAKENPEMNMLLSVEFPAEPFNSLVRDGTTDKIIGRILETLDPETAYFTELNGKRGGIFIVEVNNPSSVPALAEPFFPEFNACCQFHILMSPEDLKRPDSESLAKSGNEFHASPGKTLPLPGKKFGEF